MEQGQARGRGELRAFRPRPCCFSYRGVFLLLSCQPSSHIPSADQLPRAPIPPLPRSVPVTAVLWGYVASTALSRGSPHRRSLAEVQGLGEQRLAAAAAVSPQPRLPQGRACSANQLALGLGTVGEGPKPRWRSRLGSVPQEPALWLEGRWVVAFLQLLPTGREPMGPKVLTSDPGDAQPRPAPAPTVRGQQIFN